MKILFLSSSHQIDMSGEGNYIKDENDKVESRGDEGKGKA